MKSMLFRRIASVICLTCLCIISFASLGPVQSASAYSVKPCDGFGCDGQWPQFHKECFNDIQYPAWKDVNGGQIDLIHSLTCHAFFVESIASASYSNQLYVEITRSNPDSPNYNNAAPGKMFYSRMVGWENGQAGERVGGRGCVGMGSGANCANLYYP